MATVTEYSGCTVCCGGGFTCSCMPATIYADLTSLCADFSANAVPFTQSGSDIWDADAASLPAGFASMALTCIDDVLLLSWIFDFADCGSGSVSATSSACSPFEASFTGAIPTDCCGPSGGTFDANFYE